jgi:DNA anti-recombination protein RmuC
MDIYAIILIAIGLVVVIGFLKQFGILGGRGLIFAIAAVGLFFGISLFQAYRRRREDEDFKRREKELKEREKRLKEMTEEYDLSKEEVYEMEAALEREKAEYAKRILEIEAEKEADIKKAKERINAMPIPELLDEFSRIAN